MGAWGLKAFENDSALDFVEQLRNSKNPMDDINLVLLAAKSCNWLEFDEAAEILAAAEFLATAMGAQEATVAMEDMSIVKSINVTEAVESSANCVRVLKAIGKNSEFHDLVAEGGEEDLLQWREYIDGLIESLESVPKPIKKKVSKKKKKVFKGGELLALELRSGNRCFAKVLFASKVRKGSLLIALYPETSRDEALPAERPTSYVAHFWTYQSCLQAWSIVGRELVTDEELLLTRCQIGSSYIEQDQKVEPDPKGKYPMQIGYFADSLLHAVHRVFDEEYVQDEGTE